MFFLVVFKYIFNIITTVVIARVVDKFLFAKKVVEDYEYNY